MSAAAAAVPQLARAQNAAPVFPKGAIIRTLLKDYAPEELGGGATLFHEHMQLAADFMPRFLAATAAVRAANGLPPAPARGGGPGPSTVARGPLSSVEGGRGPAAPAGPDIMRDVDLMTAEVKKAASDGHLACIVDGGHDDMGRDINFLRQVAMKSGVPIVAGGGFYNQPFYPKEISTMSEEQIVKALIKQADDETLGAFGEIGSWDEITADERKVFRAVGKAHVATNLPIFTHTGIPGKSALEQLDLLEDGLQLAAALDIQWHENRRLDLLGQRLDVRLRLVVEIGDGDVGSEGVKGLGAPPCDRLIVGDAGYERLFPLEECQ